MDKSIKVVRYFTIAAGINLNDMMMMMMKIMMMMVIITLLVDEPVMSRKQKYEIRSSNRKSPISAASPSPLLDDLVYLRVLERAASRPWVYNICLCTIFADTREYIAAIRPGSGTGVVHLLSSATSWK